MNPNDEWASKIAGAIIRSVAELPDRNSPECQPEMMLVTAEELRMIVTEAIAAAPHFGAGEVTSTAQILIEEIGSAGPENAEDAARRACGVIQRQADQIVSADARIAALSRLLAEAGEVVADAARYLAIDPRGREAELARLNAMVEEIGRAM